MHDIMTIFAAGVLAVVCLTLAYRLLMFRGEVKMHRGMAFNARENRFEPTSSVSNETVSRVLEG